MIRFCIVKVRCGREDDRGLTVYASRFTFLTLRMSFRQSR